MRNVSRILASALAATVSACGTANTNGPDATVDGPSNGNDAASDAIALADGAEAAPPDPCAPTAYTPLEPNDCDSFLRLPCGLPDGAIPRNDCFFSLNDCDKLCGEAFWFNCRAIEGSCADGGDGGIVVLDDGGGLIVDCAGCLGGPGRIPSGLMSVWLRGRSAVGLTFARASYLEAASVVSFERLARELRTFGAPQKLVRAAERAARDETRHARVTARIARRFGATAPRPQIADIGQRSLAQVAHENAVAGCVEETYAAIEAAWQGRAARDPSIRRSMRAIARDEARHASLSWAIGRWADPKLRRADRQRIHQGMRDAVARLHAGTVEVPRTVVSLGGMPPPKVRRTLIEELDRRLWRAF